MDWDVSIFVSLERSPDQVFMPGIRHDPARAVQYANAIYGGEQYADRGTTNLDLNPRAGLVCVGAYDGAVVVSDADIFGQEPADLLDRMIAILPRSTCCLLWIREEIQTVMFRLYRDGVQVRQVLMLDSSEGGASAELGDRLPEEAPFWANAPLPIDGEVTPLPFVPVNFGLEMMRAYAFGQRLDEPGNALSVRALPAQQFSSRQTRKRFSMFARRWRA